ncbi:hypothetical protein Tco_1416956, partial [Tanacetum coccineum]
MALSIADQIALDDALVAPADRLKIGKCNLRLSSDVTSKEATLQVLALDTLRDIKEVSDVECQKLLHTWKFICAVINKCLCGTPSIWTVLRLSQAQILWGHGMEVTHVVRAILPSGINQEDIRNSASLQSRQETHSSHASGSGADEGTGGFTTRVPMLLNEDDSDMTLKDVKVAGAGVDVEDTHVTLTPVNPDGQQQSSSVSSGFVSNMLNPNLDTGVDDIFRQHTEVTSLMDTNVTAIVEPFFTRPPTPHPIV